jgi:archaellum component FlaG (FlaF/FlaG flagellin family)
MAFKKLGKSLNKLGKSVKKTVLKPTGKFINKNAPKAYTSIIQPIGKGIIEKTGKAIDVVIDTASVPSQVATTVTENSTTFLIAGGLIAVAFIFYQMKK